MGQTVGGLRDRGIFVLAVVLGSRDYAPNPAADRFLKAGEEVIVSGSADDLRELRERA
jgi:K+/H+ antiporter YhaU regulatory subunit KhtT